MRDTLLRSVVEQALEVIEFLLGRVKAQDTPTHIDVEYHKQLGKVDALRKAIMKVEETSDERN